MTNFSKRTQDIINQYSMMMNVDSDIAKACKKADIHPLLTEVLLKMHGTQHDLDKEMQNLRKAVMEVVKAIDMMANNTEATRVALQHLSQRAGISYEELFMAPKEDDNDA